MLKGHVFSKQLFGNPIFALFINTFLNGENGVSDNYGSGMELSYSGSNVTIGDGSVCIQGRFIEEDSSTTINVGTDNNFCKLVLEVNLDVENTTTEFNQGTYKVIKNAADYPTLTQGDIVKNNSGIYQYELARFKNSSQGITDFQDKRTFLDFSSIYAEIRQHIRDIDDGSAFQPKSNYKIIYGKTNPISDDGTQCQAIVNYPEGFNKDNCVVISIMFQGISNLKNWCAGSSFDTSNTLSGSVPSAVKLGNDNITINFKNILLSNNSVTIPTTSEYPTGANLTYRLVLMKLPELVEGVDYILGDVNGDGQINEQDYPLISQFIMGNLIFTQKQYKAADVNKDGQISSADYVKLKNYVEGKEPLN